MIDIKYHNKKVLLDGIMFDSKKEAHRYTELRLLEKAGEIKDLQLQKEFLLIPAQCEKVMIGRYKRNDVKRGIRAGDLKYKLQCIEKPVKYIADFSYYNASGELVVEDAKGVRTKEYTLKRKLMLYIHHIRIKEI